MNFVTDGWTSAHACVTCIHTLVHMHTGTGPYRVCEAWLQLVKFKFARAMQSAYACSFINFRVTLHVQTKLLPDGRLHMSRAKTKLYFTLSVLEGGLSTDVMTDHPHRSPSLATVYCRQNCRRINAGAAGHGQDVACYP